MGLFSGKTKIYVASSAYNMAGDIATRPNYLKTTVIGNIVSNTGFTMADTIQSSYMNGPGIRMRLFSSWSKNNYDDKVGMAGSSLGVLAYVDSSIVASQLPAISGSTTYVQSAEIGFADFEQWCDQYLYEKFPKRIMEKFEIDIDEDTNEITMISQVGGTTIKFFPTNFVPGALYLYADYSYYKEPRIEPPVIGPENIYDKESDLPSTLLWTVVSKTNKPETTPLTTTTTVTKKYSDGRPDVVTTTPVTVQYNWTSWINIYKRGFTSTPDDTTVVLDNRVMTQSKHGWVDVVTTSDTKTETDPSGVVITTITSKVADTLVNFYVSQSTSNNTVMTAVGSPHMYIYKQGSGNAVLDALFDTPASDNRFYPFIPIRNDKRWVENDPIYPDCKKALRKATGGKLDTVVKEIKDNKDIDDIQYIYGAFGCSLNSPEDTAKEYIYRFFLLATESFPPDPQYPTLEDLVQGFADANAAAELYFNWWNSSPKVGIAPPPPQYPVVPKRSFRVSSNKGYKYDMTLDWNFVFETAHSGQAWAGAKQSQLRSRYAGNIQLTRYSFRKDATTGKLTRTSTNYDMQEFELLWQEGKNSYRRLRVFGLNHSNRVYKNKSVNIDVAEAMNDPEESGFIIPLHTNIYRSMSLTHSTQLATACSYLVFNSYQKVKQKWYTTSAFKVVVIVVAIVVSIFTMGAGGAGILGAYGAVGASLGFVGLAAVIVGAVANAIAAMILISIIQAASTKLFGDKIGFIVAAIASVVAMNVGTAMSTGTTMSTMAGNMMNAQNIMQLTSSVGNGIGQYINASTADTIRKAEETMQQYKSDMLAINKQYEDMFGTNGQGVIDPMQFVSIESLDTFLARTTLTGSDIAGMSLDMVGSFADMTLDLSLKT